MPRTADNGFDAAILDRDNHTIGLVEAKTHPVETWTSSLPTRLARFPERVAFVLAIDPNSILLYRPSEGSLGEPLVRLDTRQVLQQYDPEFPRERVFEFYLLTLVEAWLRDLAYHWKSETPPGSEELATVGLLEQLEGGTTLSLGA